MKQSIQTLATAALATFRNAYIEAIVFTEEDQIKESYEEEFGDKESDEPGFTTELDVSAEHFHADTVAKIATDCEDFLRKAVNAGLLDPCDEHEMSQAGHDFWLTRNGHGVGFWESGRGWKKKQGKELTDLSKTYPETNLYRGDDGQFYF